MSRTCRARQCSISSSSAIPSSQPKALNPIHTQSQHVIRKLLHICLGSSQTYLSPQASEKSAATPETPPLGMYLVDVAQCQSANAVSPVSELWRSYAYNSVKVERTSAGIDYSLLSSWPKSSEASGRSLPSFYHISVLGRAQYSLQNLWKPQDIIAFDQAGPSRPPVEHQRDPLADWHASSSFSPTTDMFSTDMPASYTTLQRPLDEIFGVPDTRSEVCG